jgi:hypothetical protein
MTDTETSLRDSISAAFDKVEGEAEPVQTTATEAPEPMETSTSSDVDSLPGVDASTDTNSTSSRSRDPKGRFASKTGTPSATPAPKQAESTTTTTPAPKPQAQPNSTPAPQPGVTTEALKAPQSWKATTREKWTNIPADVQQEIIRREREVSTALSRAAESTRPWEPLANVFQKHGSFVQSQGVAPHVIVDNLLQTAQALQHPDPSARASILAHLVRDFRIPIEALADALDKAPQAQATAPQHLDPRAIAAQVRQEITRDFQAQREQVAAQKAQEQIEKFSEKAEFFNDVRQRVGVLMHAAHQDGLALTLEQAYDAACKMDPQISAVLEQRAKAQQANALNASTQRARNAASSVRGQPTGGSNSPQSGNSLRDTIEAAMNAANGR